MLKTTTVAMGLCFLAAAGAAPALAHPGDCPTPPKATALHLSAEGTVQAIPDRLEAVLVARSQSKNAATAQQEVNNQIKAVSDEVSAVQPVSLKIRGYSVSSSSSEGKKEASWVASQTIELQSEEATPLLDLVGHLQSKGLILQSLGWDLSKQKRDILTQKATAEALKTLQKEAKEAAQNMGLSMGHYCKITIERASPVFYRPVMMSLARKADSAAAPQATQDKQDVTASVSAVVILNE